MPLLRRTGHRNDLDGTPVAIRMLQPLADAVGHDVEVVLDGGVRRGADVTTALTPGHLVVPDDFHRALGADPAGAPVATPAGTGAL